MTEKYVVKRGLQCPSRVSRKTNIIFEAIFPSLATFLFGITAMVDLPRWVDLLLHGIAIFTVSFGLAWIIHNVFLKKCQVKNSR